ncbi:hypothetical protein D3C83_113670 [compost metagenome]
MHAPPFAVQVPSSLQREDFLQSASATATHLPSFAPHLPSLSQAAVFLHDSSLAAQRPSSAEH